MVREISAEQLLRELADQESAPLLVDVREQGEFDSGHLDGAQLASLGGLPAGLDLPKGSNIVVYCAVGQRSRIAGELLVANGYRQIRSLAGGTSAFVAAGGRLVGGLLSDEQQQRYARHTILAGVGASGQRRLLDSRVVLLGAGGLGSPAGLYLAAAGVGQLVVIDDDRVDRSNLQRQIIHTDARLGQKKADSAREALRALNPQIEVEAIDERLTQDNSDRLLAGADVIINGVDNFTTRYLLSDAGVRLAIPIVDAAIVGFDGQLTVLAPPAGPCYRCLYPVPPPPELAPNCAENGVIGALPGVLGSMQAMEAIKLLLGLGQPLVGRLLLYDAQQAEFTQLRVRRDPGCPACGDGTSGPLIDPIELCRFV